MKHLLSIIVLCIAVLLTACDNRTTNVLSLSFYQDSTSELVEVYKHGHRFDGEAWNRDGNFCVSATRGVLTYVTLCYNSGAPAIKCSDDHLDYYDNDGLNIPAEKFRVMCPTLEAKFDSLYNMYITIIKYGSHITADLP